MENSDILWYNSVDMFHSTRGNNYKDYENLPGFKNFRHMFGFFSANFSTTDRTGVIVPPVKTTLLDQCKMPEFIKVDYNFSELCDKRARQLLDHAKNTNRKLVFLYSGGIDSTLMVVSLLKIATEEELKNNIVLLLSQYSISENPRFFEDHISKKFKLESSYNFHGFLGNDKYVVVNGEGGDQLFGSAVCGNLFKNKGAGLVFHEPTYDIMFQIFQEAIKDEVASEKIVTILTKLVKAAPIEINTVYHYFWWINFALKWQSVYVRSIAYTDVKYQNTISLEDNYFIFFNTPEMQLWSMNNTDKLVRDTWSSYKYICKDIIYDYNKDADYRDNKQKRGSLVSIVQTKPIAKAVGSNIEFYMDKYPENIWEMNNDFI